MKRIVVIVLLAALALSGCAPAASPEGGDGGTGNEDSGNDAAVVGAPVEPCTQELKDSFVPREGVEATIEMLEQPDWPAEFQSFSGQTASCAYTYVTTTRDDTVTPALIFEETRVIGVYVGLDAPTVNTLVEASAQTDPGWYTLGVDADLVDDQIIDLGWGNYTSDTAPWYNLFLTSNAETSVTTFAVDHIVPQS